MRTNSFLVMALLLGVVSAQTNYENPVDNASIKSKMR